MPPDGEVPQSSNSHERGEEMEVVDSPPTSKKESVLSSLEDMLSRPFDVYHIIVL